MCIVYKLPKPSVKARVKEKRGVKYSHLTNSHTMIYVVKVKR